MIKLIAYKDFLLNLTSVRFVIGFMMCLLVIPFTLVVSMDRYKQQHNLYKLNLEAAENNFKSVKVYSMARPEVVKEPERLSIFSNGIGDNLGSSAKIHLGNYPLFLTGKVNTIDNPLLNAFFSIDFVAVIGIIMSLLGLVFSYDCFTRENEDGTLKMILVNKISRTSFFMGKLLGILITLLPILLFCYLLGILYILVSPDIILNANDWLSVLLLFASSIIYVIVFVLIGMFISSMVKQSSTSIIIGLLVWIWFLFLMPNIASYSAQSFSKINLYDNVDYVLKELNAEYQQKLFDEQLKLWEKYGTYSYLNNYGSDDGGIGFSGGHKNLVNYHLELTPVQTSMMIEYAGKKWAIQKNYYDGLVKQSKVQQNLALLSPAGIFSQLSSSLCHTDANSYRLYMDKVREYRETIIHYFKSNKIFESMKWFTPSDYEVFREGEEYETLLQGRMDAYYKSAEAVKDYEENVYPKEWNNEFHGALDLSGFPRFEYKSELMGSTLNFILIRFALLMLIATILLIGTMFRFNRYRI